MSSCSTSGQARKRLMPPTYFFLSLALVAAARFALPMLAYATPFTLVLGALFVGAGVALNLMSDSALKRLNTPVSPDATPSALVLSGVFRLTRNPMYLGMACIVAGAALLVGEPVGLSVAAAFALIMNSLFVPGEERNLETAFGSEYASYKASVRRWV